RGDAGVAPGVTVQPAFDSMIAKLVVHADDRDRTLVRARRALAELEVVGPATVAPFAAVLLDDPAFATDTFAVSTQWIETELMPRMTAQPRPASADTPSLQRFVAELDGRLVTIGLPGGLLAGLAGAAGSADAAGGAVEADDGAAVLPPAPGALVDWLVDDGAAVEAGQDVAVLDAMKMETRVAAPRAGVLRHTVEVGAVVGPDEPIATVEEE